MIKTTNPELTEFLNLENGPILIYGESATGKTCLSTMAAIEASKTGKVVFIDTEGGFSTERLSQIYPDYESILKNIFFIKAKSFKEQHKIIQNLESMNNISLIVIDTIGNFFRAIVRNHSDLASSCLKKQLSILEKKSRQNTGIIITTQVYTDINKHVLEPIGGNLLKKFCPTILQLKKDNSRRLIKRTIIKEKPKEPSRDFEITEKGIILNKPYIP